VIEKVSGRSRKSVAVTEPATVDWTVLSTFNVTEDSRTTDKVFRGHVTLGRVVPLEITLGRFISARSRPWTAKTIRPIKMKIAMQRKRPFFISYCPSCAIFCTDSVYKIRMPIIKTQTYAAYQAQTDAR
jgi:hypothetical protein